LFTHSICEVLHDDELMLIALFVHNHRKIPVLQEFPGDKNVVLPNTPFDRITLVITPKDPSRPMEITVEVIGCFHPEG